MVTVVREGRCPRSMAIAIQEDLGPDGRVAMNNRREPGYLGSLFLTRLDADTSLPDVEFIVVEMWDERHVAGPSILPPPQVGSTVTWIRPGALYSTIR
jgi:hypothetical protein